MNKFFAELWQYMLARKRLWLVPIVVIILLLSLLVISTQQSSLAAFIYTVF